MPTHFRLMDLPRELRDQVYHFALSLPNNKHTDPAGYSRYTVNPRWLRLDKQTHQEALRIWRRNVTIAITTPWPESHQHVASQGFVPLLATGKAGDDFKDNHLEVRISTPSIAQISAPHERYILALEDLRTFCDFWYYSDMGFPGLNGHLNLTLILKDPHCPKWEERPIPKTLQKALIEPFGAVQGLLWVKIEGEHYESIETAMRKDMEKVHKTPEECLEEATKLKDEGNALLQKKQYRAAIKKYEESFQAVHIIVKGRRRSIFADAFFHAELRSGPNKGEFGHMVRIILRFILVSNIILAYLNLEDYEEAHFWGMRTISLMRETSPDEPLDFPAHKQIGKIYYRTAKACKHLGAPDDARKYFRIALKYLPGDRVGIEDEIRAVGGIVT